MGFFNRDKNKEGKGATNHAYTSAFFNMSAKEGKSAITQDEAKKLLAAMENRPTPRPDETVTFKDFKKITGISGENANRFGGVWSGWYSGMDLVSLNRKALEEIAAGVEVSEEPKKSESMKVRSNHSLQTGDNQDLQHKEPHKKKNWREAALENIERNRVAGITGDGSASAPGLREGLGR